jgi:D-alanyl-D-alanine carboxypeptidase
MMVLPHRAIKRLFITLVLCLAATCIALPVTGDAYAKTKTKTTAKIAPKTTASARKIAPSSSASADKKSTSAAHSSSKKTVSSKKHSSHVSTADARYSAIVIDATTGQILYEKNSHAIRYPASLTKMMTLYLTFDALQKGRITMDQTFPVSAKAASMPQTNIALQEGSTLSVRDAIGALVIRSANDAAIVLGEGLGRTTWNFALTMTQKARSLGMRDTVFRNPNGLPDSQQYTTAYDLAILALALRRDFPEYYPYFKTTEFSYNGRTYPTHNHLVGHYPGCDGLKTGFINASGYNLVASARRNNMSIVGVVMGGRTSRSRDSDMVRLLDKGFVQIAQKKPIEGAHIEMAEAKGGNPAADAEPAQTVEDAAEAQKMVEAALSEAPVAGAPAATAPPAAPEETDAGEEAAAASPAAQEEKQEAKAEESPSAEKRIIIGARWGIQVGSFSSEDQAYAAAEQAISTASAELDKARITVNDQRVGKTYLHRVRIEDIEEKQARGACQKLEAKKRDCMVYRMEAGQ